MAAALRRIPKQKLFGQLSLFNNDSSIRPPPSVFLSRRGESTSSSKLFIGGISYHTTEKGLLEAFSQYGKVIEANVVMDRESDQSRGFGFVTFSSKEDAEKAKTEMSGKPLDGRAIFVGYAKPQTRYSSGMPIARGPPEPTKVE